MAPNQTSSERPLIKSRCTTRSHSMFVLGATLNFTVTGRHESRSALPISSAASRSGCVTAKHCHLDGIESG